MKTLCAVSAIDSGMKYCQFLAESYAEPGDRIERIVLVDQHFHLDAETLQNIGVTGKASYLTLAQFFARLREGQYDVIFHYHAPPGYLAFYRAMQDWLAKRPMAKKRPLLVTGFSGMISEHMAMGLTSRLGSDVICLSTATNLRHGKTACHYMGVDDSVLVQTGYPVALPGNGRVLRTVPNSGRNIVFATQPHFPGGLRQRLYILVELLKLCRACPQDTVTIKLRMQEGKRAIHDEPYHYEALFRALRVDKPDNLVFAYGDMAGVLDTADILLSMSSTAVMEAIAKGVPAAIIADFGLSAEDGLPIFFGSGLFVSIRDLAEGWAGTADPAWLEANGFGPDDHPDRLHQRLDTLLNMQDEQASALPLPDIYCTEKTLPFAFAVPPYQALQLGVVHTVSSAKPANNRTRKRQDMLLAALKRSRDLANSLSLQVKVLLIARGYLRSGW